MSEDTNTYDAGTTRGQVVRQPASTLQIMADRLGCESGKLLATLKATCFKGATNEQMMALCIVANQYHLNPFTKELYAFPDKGGGIVPVVGVDGWARIVNEHPQFDGMEFTTSDDGTECTCKIFRKDRAHPIAVTEYLAECRRNTDPWRTSPRRMLRHKAMIQCARYAFGFAGLYDPDEAERIVQAQSADAEEETAKPSLADVVKAKAAEVVATPDTQSDTQPDTPPETPPKMPQDGAEDDIPY